MILLSLFVAYCALCLNELYHLSGPPSCPSPSSSSHPNRRCLLPLVPADWTSLSVSLSLQTSPHEYTPQPNCTFTVTASQLTLVAPSVDHTCYLNLTSYHRHRSLSSDVSSSVEPFSAEVRVERGGRVVRTLVVELSEVRDVEVGTGKGLKDEYKDLLDMTSSSPPSSPSSSPSPSPPSSSLPLPPDPSHSPGTYRVPHWKHTRSSPLTIVYTDNHQPSPRPPPNTKVVQGRSKGREEELLYTPDIYSTDMSTLASSAIEIGPHEFYPSSSSSSSSSFDSPPSPRPPVKLTITFAALSYLPSSLLRQLGGTLSSMEALLADLDSTASAGLFDEIRYMLSPRYLYRFVLTNVISVLHVYFSFLAFKNDVGFYVGKKDMKGISASSLLTGFFSSLIIFLYLADSGGTSSVVLLTIGAETAVDLWKLNKILRPAVTSQFPFVKISDPSNRSKGESETLSYDSIATKNLWLALLPFLIGSAAFSLKHYKYRSWYSFIVAHASNMVYT